MEQRPGSTLTRRALHFFVVADCSGSMAADGKMQALNNAVRETIPHLREVAAANPHAQLLVRAIGFSTGAWWHVEEPTAVDALQWEDLHAGGYSDLGAALELLVDELAGSRSHEPVLAPAVLLVSDGLPTDDYEHSLARLLQTPLGRRSVRLAVGIGRDYDDEVLRRFIGVDGIAPITATDPEQIVRHIRWASIQASQMASRAASPAAPFGPVAADAASADDDEDLVW